MGKRSSFERVEKDFYRTIDPRAVEILSPFLVSIDSPPRYDELGNHEEGYVKYAEPCVGDFDLARQLSSHGHVATYMSDISMGIDALSIQKESLLDVDVIITNPPWSRDILHPMITHFSSLRPTWLLFDADWMHTKQSSPYIKELCTDIVSVGRLKWIEGTTMSGKDNCAWYRFDIGKEQDTKFHGR